MVWKKLGLLVTVAALLASPALAQLKHGYGKPLNEAEAKAALFGIDMRGYSPSYGFSWRECIQPNGETLYEMPDQTLKGRLMITPAGQACFSYNDDNYASMACFSAYKTGDGVRFETEGPAPVVFVTTKIVTGVKSCEPHDLIG